jgi:hypothetical protein
VRGAGSTLLVLLLVVGGCTGNEETEPVPSTRSATDAATGPENLSGTPQGATLRMAPGRSTVRFQITALDPPTHVYDVRIAAPASANVGVRIYTWYGATLHVLGSTRNPDWCKVRRRRSVCQLPFPLLEAQRPGLWTVIVTKRSDAAATVNVVVTFRRP